MKVVAELAVVPVGVGTSLAKYIAECEHILKSKNLTIELHAQGTNIEGELEVVFSAIKECIEGVHQLGAPRLATNIKISSRTDKTETLKSMVESVEDQM